MGRGRKRKVKFTVKAETTRSVFAVLFIALSFVILVSFLASLFGANSFLQQGLKILFGYATLLLAPFLFVLGVINLPSLNWKISDPRVLLGCAGVLFSGATFLNVFYTANDSLKMAQKGGAGGYLGHYLSLLLTDFLSFYGAVILLSAILIISLIVIVDKSLEDIYKNIKSKTSSSSIDDEEEEDFDDEDAEEKVSIFERFITVFSKLNFFKKKQQLTAKEKRELFDMEDDSFEGFESATEESGADDTELIEDTGPLVYADPTYQVVPSMSEPFLENTHNFVTKSSARSTSHSSKEAVILEKTLEKSTGHDKPPKTKTSNKNSLPLFEGILPYADKIWENPPLNLLSDPSKEEVDRSDAKARVKVIEETMRSFGIDASIKKYEVGPSVTQYSLEATKGTKVAKISTLHNDLALALASPNGTVRIEAPIPGTSLIGIEVPNVTRRMVVFKELFNSDPMKYAKSKLAIVMGKDVSGLPVVYDIAKMPHLLVAGSTGSGKSVFLQSLIFSILYRAGPNEVKFIMIDPKRVELTYYNDIPHLYTPVVTDLEKAPAVFKWATVEMDRRYKLLETAKVRNIDSYNEKSGFQAMPYIVIIADELAEIMMADVTVEKSIIRLAQLARAVGIHLVLATQRPSANIITGLIKANIPTRVSFNVTSNVDSRVIIDQSGAEKLLGKGDMLFVPPDSPKPIRLQGVYIDEKEINSLANYLRSTGIKPEYKDDIFVAANMGNNNNGLNSNGDVDTLFDEAVEAVQMANKASASLLQRRLSIGYARAARILDELEAHGIIGPAQGSKPRDILISGALGVEEITSFHD